MTEEVLTAQEWRKIVDRVVAVWGGYQLGVDFNSGGPETLAKDEWFREVLAEHIFTTRGLKADDLENWLNNVLYTEFNLILDDESVYPISIFLIEAFGYWRHNDLTHLDRLMSTLPSVEDVRKKNSPLYPGDMHCERISNKFFHKRSSIINESFCARSSIVSLLDSHLEFILESGFSIVIHELGDGNLVYMSEVIKKSLPDTMHDKDDEEMDDISEDSESEPEEATIPIKERPPRTVTDGDGWTTILRK